ncbi:hypothetical protein MAC_04494 [Metarhizium acridum CQMa 102]|uniref:Bacteriocin-protection protein n=1 Tax=Metarhizium acridum (strain CQMa 102) TaxID=655827 RepID=E9E3Q0_METAQ|nr:uncharacterized protein MAC_04494 [Metarhizium acridum CQMa 102]EFY89475.1 hypothetical protein MAC_04494 [Metarhizium acridum CQMa 102]
MARRGTRLSTKTAPSTPITTSRSTPAARVTNKDPETISFPSPTDFNAWLLTNGTTTPSGIWLKIAKKASCIPSVSYDEAIDTALCHGWIDGQRKVLDGNYFVQRFTPRRRNSLWSKRNVDKAAALVAAGRMHDTGMAEVDAARADGRWDSAYAGPATMQVPADFAAALQMNQKAGEAFERLGRSARFPFLWRVTTAKKEETRRRRIDTFVEMLARGETLT